MRKLITVKPLSVNEAWKGRRYKTDAYKAFEKECMLLLPRCKIPDGYLRLDLEFGFSNSGSDWDNPIKPFVDILQKKYLFDDNRIMESTVKKRVVKKGFEYIKFDIKSFCEKREI